MRSALIPKGMKGNYSKGTRLAQFQGQNISGNGRYFTKKLSWQMSNESRAVARERSELQSLSGTMEMGTLALCHEG
jgi:hypothetical protein